MSNEQSILNLLIVEDNPGDYTLIKEYLKMSRLPDGKIVHATSMAEAAELVKQSMFDIALLDLSLPDSFGIDSVITMDHLMPKTPIVVFSGQSNVETAMEAISLGAQDYLVKGEFDEQLLGKTIHYSIERKKMVERLRQSNERYEFVNKATLDTIWEWNFELSKGTWGEGIINTYGYDVNDMEYDQAWTNKFIHPEDREEIMESINNHIHSRKKHWQGEFRFRCADGSYKYVYDRGYILYNEKGGPSRMIGAITDITEKINLETELAEQEIRQQKIITEVTIQAQEKERNEIGKELHDNINQVLATVKIYLSMSLDRENQHKDLTDKSLINVNYAIEEIRKLSKSLVSPSLGDIGLEEALKELIEEINLISDFRVEMEYSLDENRKPDKNLDLMLYRIAQEQLNNIRKYAKASNVFIKLYETDNFLFFNITDNGIGFDTGIKAKGIGLKNIRSRVDFYKGEMLTISEPGKGCTIDIKIPLP
ncbi:MAG TPA: PAS domain-containing protein [Chitinophagaceae bacterium]|nr:PAS domain-containing protein [Chitinophagaceae bacterium]